MLSQSGLGLNQEVLQQQLLLVDLVESRRIPGAEVCTNTFDPRLGRLQGRYRYWLGIETVRYCLWYLWTGVEPNKE
jgi:hypothetical protein